MLRGNFVHMFKMKHSIKAFIVAVCLTFGLHAQTVERFAIASAGGEGNGGGAQITWTCGESVTASLQSGGNLLTQGFQQLLLVNTTASAMPFTDLKISVYPVPCREGFFINGAFPLEKSYSYSLYNTLGGLVQKEKITGGSCFVETKNLEEGNYYLLVTNETTNKTTTYKIIKTK